MRREQVVGAVVYGQFVPEESTHPSAPDPVLDAPASDALLSDEQGIAAEPDADGGVTVTSGDAVVASGGATVNSGGGAVASGGAAVDLSGGAVGSAGVTVNSDGVAVNAEGVPVDSEGKPVDDGKFLVRLDNFTGPFDLLLQLIGKHKLDVTEVALHQVTDDFIAYIRAMGDDWDLDEASEFLLVAATLLDLKAARLLPAADVEDEEDLALLEARDLLFARLLQYKAYKEAAAHIMELEGTGMRRWPRLVTMEPRYAEALPDLVLGVGPERLFKLALKQFAPKPGPPQVSIAHIHQVRVSVREHAALLRDRLRRAGQATFSLLVADCDNTLEVVARFLALLELYREGLVDFEQPVSLDELTVRWIGGDNPDAEFDIDDYEGSKPEPDTAAAPLPGDETDEELSADDVSFDDDDDDLDDDASFDSGFSPARWSIGDLQDSSEDDEESSDEAAVGSSANRVLLDDDYESSKPEPHAAAAPLPGDETVAGGEEQSGAEVSFDDLDEDDLLEATVGGGLSRAGSSFGDARQADDSLDREPSVAGGASQGEASAAWDGDEPVRGGSADRALLDGGAALVPADATVLSRGGPGGDGASSGNGSWDASSGDDESGENSSRDEDVSSEVASLRGTAELSADDSRPGAIAGAAPVGRDPIAGGSVGDSGNAGPGSGDRGGSARLDGRDDLGGEDGDAEERS